MFDRSGYLAAINDFKEATEALGGVYRYWLEFPGVTFSTERFIEFCANRGLIYCVSVRVVDDVQKYIDALQYVVDTRGSKLYHFTYLFDHNSKKATFCFEVEEEALIFRLRF